MQVRTFEAENMASALKKVKEELGPEALILSTRTVRKGGMGLLGKPMLEVTAAVETPDPEPAPQPASDRLDLAAAFASSLPQRAPEAADDISYADIWRKRKVLDPIDDAPEPPRPREQASSDNVDSLRNEINELKELVKGAVQSGLHDKPAATGKKKSGIGQMMNALLARGMEPGPAEIVVRRALADYPPRDRSVTLEGFLGTAIADLVRTEGPVKRGGKQRRVALIGPTGVGKTTTIAKLAANHLLNRGGKVALVTIDIYRIAAVEQLKVYGEIMKIPVDVVLSPEDLAKVLARHQDKDLVLIDTAGRSPKDQASLQELAKFIRADWGIENHLVLSATTREAEMEGVIKRFGRLPVHSMIFTKLDECEHLGPLLNVHLKNKYPLSYLANGQRVPEDLVLAEPKGLARLIMGKP